MKKNYKDNYSKYRKEGTEIIIHKPEIKKDDIENILKEYQNIALRILKELKV